MSMSIFSTVTHNTTLEPHDCEGHGCDPSLISEQKKTTSKNALMYRLNEQFLIRDHIQNCRMDPCKDCDIIADLAVKKELYTK